MFRNIFIGAFVFLLSASTVFAAGGGGGGSVPIQVTPVPASVPIVTAPLPLAPVIIPAPAPKPAAPSNTWKLKCFNKPTLRARIDCRMSSSHDDLEKEIYTKYLPEECRSLPKSKQAGCVTLYKKFQPCWNDGATAERMACAREVIGMSSTDIVQMYASCRDLPSKAQATCKAAEREKVFTYAKFKFYDLSEYAEEYLAEGRVSRKHAVDFVTLMETKKQQFNAAGSGNIARKWQIVKDVRAAWPKFLAKVKFEAQAGDEQVMIWPDDTLGETTAQLQDMK